MSTKIKSSGDTLDIRDLWSNDDPFDFQGPDIFTLRPMQQSSATALRVVSSPAGADDGMIPPNAVQSDVPAPAELLRDDGFVNPTASALTEVSFLTGVDYSTHALTSTSYWGLNGGTAHKWGTGVLGTGATITYNFLSTSGFSANEQNTVREAMALWSSVANVTFVETANQAAANAVIQRGASGSGAFESDQGHLTAGSGSTLGTHTGQSIINIETGATGFDLSGSWNVVGGYGIQTIFHELGHLLGLGHGGNYNGNVNPATQQFGPYDERSWTAMSYIYWNSNATAKFHSTYELTGTNWGVTSDGFDHQSSGTYMPLDILAIQQLYGAATSTPLSGGQIFGFHSNIAGLLQTFFDFTINTNPVVTIFDTGSNNTLDLSGFSQSGTINLNPGSFSSVEGHTNNIAIAYGTAINNAVGGTGDDLIIVNPNLIGTLTGDGGNDTFQSTMFGLSSYTITDFSVGDRVNFTNGDINTFDFSRNGIHITYSGFQMTLSNNPVADIYAVTDATYGGVDLVGKINHTRDYNGNGASDFLLQDNDGTVAMWFLNGTTFSSGAVVANPGPTWHIVAEGDLNSNGKTDLIFQNNDGTVAAWLMNGSTFVSGAVIGSPGPSWHAIASGDFNGDHKADILLQNDDGSVASWIMDGASFVSGGVIGNPGPSWHVIGTGDFNADATSEILFQNQTSGAIAEWSVSVSNFLSGAFIGNPGTSWRAVGTGDFNGDGKADVLLQNNDGSVADWTMNGTSFVTGGVIGNPGPSWHVIGAADLTNDGRSEIMLQDTSGVTAEWQVSGTTFVSGVLVGAPTPDWHLV